MAESWPTDPHTNPDLIFGAEAIALYIYGDVAKAPTIYKLRTHSNVPVFRFGGRLCLSVSRYQQWLDTQSGVKAKGLAGG